jgi:hypothetical protein
MSEVIKGEFASSAKTPAQLFTTLLGRADDIDTIVCVCRHKDGRATLSLCGTNTVTALGLLAMASHNVSHQ